jgi:hydrogenase expression/formation protein HypE
MMHQLLETLVLPSFSHSAPDAHHDAAVLDMAGARLAFTTDSYVVQPLFFPGGDIGQLAVNGTVNDLSMCGARPLFLSTAFILEEGLPMETLRRVLRSMRLAADAAGVSIVTGDTKVVERGAADGIFINTAGIGIIEHSYRIAPDQVRPGNVVLLSGDVGRHGIAVMAARENLGFEGGIESDTSPLAGLVLALLHAGIRVHCLRDLTRGGLATALVEIARVAAVQIEIEEAAIPVQSDVRGACELLGLDPVYVANEGRLIAFVDPEDAEAALTLMREHPQGAGATEIGRVTDSNPGLVTMTSWIGVPRIVEMLSGDQLPRIC